MEHLSIICVALLLAYANGANDNAKGVASLLGSGITTYGRAISWATGATLLGSLAAFLLASGLLATFSGKGLVPDAVVAMPAFTGAVALGAGLTVLLATRLGLPISTTHALVGGLAGAGYFASPAGLNLGRLGGVVLLPLIAGPMLAMLSTWLLYPLAHRLRQRLGVERQTCVCIGAEVVARLPEGATAAVAFDRTLPVINVGEEPRCRTGYAGRVLGFDMARALDSVHYLSGGAVSFARGLNDTPKIAALLLVGESLRPSLGIIAVAIVMAIGGLLGAHRVAETMAHRVTAMNPGQGLVANLVTAALVVNASRWGLPVSTTHVSVGSLFGIGTSTGSARWRMISTIALAWLITLPVAALFGAAGFFLLQALGNA
ncbi:inorganic phosphate transporter [Nitrococcus mobilis]|uniref:Phosphate transporter n=1 Tax=Nitrococcus mobilis Nb-231 TaxID=314278 RepID=A4BMC2_9GAMM|nr:inorganic phosphate transporter [Nitrococcus mobilis]EAR23460.1 Phosphate transporter [Nitrococcus mobilis Nb-231]